MGLFQEETREKLVFTDNRVRQLEAQVSEEQRASSLRKKVCATLNVYGTSCDIAILFEAYVFTEAALSLCHRRYLACRRTGD